MDINVMFPDEPVKGDRHGNNGTHSETMSVRSTLDFLEKKAASKQSVQVSSPLDLNLCLDEDKDAPANILGINGDIVIRPPALKGSSLEDLRLSEMGIRTACGMMGISPNWFKNKLNHDERFSKFRGIFNSTLSHSCEDGFLLRAQSDVLGNAEVDAFLDNDWNPISDADIVSHVVEDISGLHGVDSVAGIESIFGDRKGTNAFRIVMDEAIIDDGPASTYSTYPMVSFLSNEYGLLDARIDLGVWQVICWNGIIEAIDWAHAGWNHKGTGRDTNFYNKIKELVMMIQHYIPIKQESINRAANTKLSVQPEIVLSRLVNMKAIDKIHGEIAKDYLEFEDIDTEWDFLSVLTNSAKVINPLQKRQRAENNASVISHWDGGLDDMLGERWLSEARKNRIFSKEGEFAPLAHILEADSADREVGILAESAKNN